MGASSSHPTDGTAEEETYGARGIQTIHGSLDELDSALFEAVADGDDEATAALLAQGANHNHLSVDHDWASPLIVAAQEGSLGCLKQLLAMETIECDRADKFGFTACHTAAHWNHAACLQALLQAGARPNPTAKATGTPMHVAAARDNEECLGALLAAGADPDDTDDEGRGVYDLAVESHSHRCVAALDAWEDLQRRDPSKPRRQQRTGDSLLAAAPEVAAAAGEQQSASELAAAQV